MSGPVLKATYASSTTTSSKTFSSSLPPLPSQSHHESNTAEDVLQQKTAYLSALRSHLGQMQSDVNQFLTQTMEDEKAAESALSGKAGGKKARQEEKEEEMYGEEDPEDEG